MTAPAQAALAMAAAGNRQLGPKGQLNQSQEPQEHPSGTAKLAKTQGMDVTGRGLANVRVNDPAEDSHFIDQTTQSETTIGAHGSNVVGRLQRLHRMRC